MHIVDLLPREEFGKGHGADTDAWVRCGMRKREGAKIRAFGTRAEFSGCNVTTTTRTEARA